MLYVRRVDNDNFLDSDLEGVTKIMKYTELKRDMQGRYCRSCINKHLETELQQADCIYSMYQNPCQSCGNMKNIVEKVKWRGLHKVLMLNKKGV